MNTQKTLIDRITDELPQLPEEDLNLIYRLIERLGGQRTKDQPSAQTGSLPFVDEIERVKEQSRQVPGRDGDQQFT